MKNTIKSKQTKEIRRVRDKVFRRYLWQCSGCSFLRATKKEALNCCGKHEKEIK